MKNQNTTIDEIIQENKRRVALLATAYDPITGQGACGNRAWRNLPCAGRVNLPMPMIENEKNLEMLDATTYGKVRIKYDFEYWCATCATIRDKVTGRNVKLHLNAPQRRVLAELERQRLLGQGIRLILLKARQWGGSTLVLMYMAWIQIVLKRNWNSLICGHKRNSSKAIKGMYSKLLRFYPRNMLDDGAQLRFKGYEGGGSTQIIEGRDCLVIMGSAHSEDAVRGFDIAMAHLSEVAFWPQTPMHKPEDLIRSVDGSILLGGLSLVVMESTANGVGSFFHEEWLKAKAGESDKTALFVPWHEIEIYRQPVANVQELWNSIDDYERDLWREGCTLEMINWYHHKRKAYGTHNMMMAEFPGNDIEAFANTGSCVFDLPGLDRLREGCKAPLFMGDIMGHDRSLKGIRLVENNSALLKIWAMPQHSQQRNRYVVAVDVGGRGEHADFSVITVIDRGESVDDKMEIVAQWRGHIDHDLLAWKAARLASFYDHACLVFESNTLETEKTDGDDAVYILNELARSYGNLYFRAKRKPGFQTNRSTKGSIIHRLIALVRDGGYIERDSDAIDEMSYYEHKPMGRFGAIDGKHDDIVMSRAIGLHVANLLQRGKVLDKHDFVTTAKPAQPSLNFWDTTPNT